DRGVAARSAGGLCRGRGGVAGRPGNPIHAAPLRGLGSGNPAPPHSTDDHRLPVPKGNGLGITTQPAFGTNERNLPRPGANLTEPQRERSLSAFPASPPPLERHAPPPSFPQTPQSSGPSPYPNAPLERHGPPPSFPQPPHSSRPSPSPNPPFKPHRPPPP